MKRTLQMLAITLMGILVLPNIPARAAQDTIKVTLLGTGTPQLNPRRNGNSTLIEAGGQVIMFDAGRNAMFQAKQAGTNLRKINNVFLTHYHSDHVNGLSDVWMMGYLGFAMRKEPLKIWGPAGVKQLTDGLTMAFAADVKIRTEQFGGNRKPGMTLVPKLVKPGVVNNVNGVKITAFEVDHIEARPALGYRIEYKGRTVVLSGDTIFSENLIKNSMGVDLLIHQIGYAPPNAMKKNKLVRRIIGHHTQPHQVAQVLNAAKPKMAVISHIVVFKMKGADLSPQGEEAMMRALRESYQGPVLLGQDLMAFEVGDTVRRLR